MIEVRETSKGLSYGHTTVGTTAVQLTSLDAELQRGVLLRAPGSLDPVPNTAIVWVGRKGVTADSAHGTGGMPLPPGESLYIPIQFANLLYVVSTANGQDLAWMTL